MTGFKAKIKAWCLRRRVLRTFVKDIDAAVDLGRLVIGNSPQGPVITVSYELVPEDKITVDHVHVSGATREYVDVSQVVAKYPREAVVSGMTAHDFYNYFMDDSIRNAADELANHASREGTQDMIRILIYAGVAVVVAIILIVRLWA